jgi:CBS domain-containing protein
VVETARATPLLALEAVALDSETTSLDPRRARLVEIAGLRLGAAKIGDESFDTLVDPGEPIPALSTAIHRIDDERVRGAPSFAEAWPRILAFAGDAVIIGYSAAYDLAVIAAETKRAGLAPWSPTALDVRLLAEVANPDLADVSLEGIAAWLGVTVEGRHSAAGDARAAAAIFTALIPRLRERGVRTLAEAEAASHARIEVTSGRGAVLREASRSPAEGDAERTLSRIDSYPYRHRVRELMSAPPLFVAGSTTIAAALDLLMQRKVSSLYVADGAGPHAAATTGIVTERDLLRALAEKGATALTLPVAGAASRPLANVPAEAFAYRAIGRMDRLRVRHLGVVDDKGEVVGALSVRDLLRLRARGALVLGDEIDAAPDVPALARAWAKLPAVAEGLLAEGVDACRIAAVISRELGALTRRAGLIAEARMEEAGQGKPPVAYALLMLGSAGRGESLLALDQDNAILFASGEPEGPEDRWFATLGGHVADILHEVGVPYCTGGVMAKNPAWRGSAATWRARVGEWVRRARPEDLLSVDIFYDFRAVHGDGALAAALWRDAYDAARGEFAFLKLLAEAAGPFEPPLGFFGLRTENGRVDLKRGGLFPIVATARVAALRYGVAAHATPARLEGIKAARPDTGTDVDALIDAHAVIVAAVLSQQLADIHAGRPPSNRVDPRRLARAEVDRLKAALRSIRSVEELREELLRAV